MVQVTSQSQRSQEAHASGPEPATSDRTTILLLACGVAYAVFYVLANDIVAATAYEGYSRTSQAISELSAIGAPTRWFLAATLPVQTALLIGFGIGVRRAAHGRRSLGALGMWLMVFAAVALLWLLFPMTSRQDMIAGTMPANDAGHIGMTIWTVVSIFGILVLGAVARGVWFRVYTAVTALAVLAFGAVTGIEAAKVPTGDPTPFMGLFERINVYGWMLWMAVLAIALIKNERTPGRVA